MNHLVNSSRMYVRKATEGAGRTVSFLFPPAYRLIPGGRKETGYIPNLSFGCLPSSGSNPILHGKVVNSYEQAYSMLSHYLPLNLSMVGDVLNVASAGVKSPFSPSQQFKLFGKDGAGADNNFISVTNYPRVIEVFPPLNPGPYGYDSMPYHYNEAGTGIKAVQQSRAPIPYLCATSGRIYVPPYIPFLHCGDIKEYVPAHFDPDVNSVYDDTGVENDSFADIYLDFINSGKEYLAAIVKEVVDPLDIQLTDVPRFQRQQDPNFDYDSRWLLSDLILI